MKKFQLIYLLKVLVIAFIYVFLVQLIFNLADGSFFNNLLTNPVKLGFSLIVLMIIVKMIANMKKDTRLAGLPEFTNVSIKGFTYKGNEFSFGKGLGKQRSKNQIILKKHKDLCPKYFCNINNNLKIGKYNCTLRCQYGNPAIYVYSLAVVPGKDISKILDVMLEELDKFNKP